MEAFVKEKQLVLNRVKCKECGEVLTSHFRHDYKTCSCPNRTTVDGGLSYLRYGGVDIKKVELKAVYLDDDYEKIRESFHWGTYGQSGKEPLHYVLLKDLSSPHILKIISLMTGRMQNWIEELLLREIKYRKERNMWIKDLA